MFWKRHEKAELVRSYKAVFSTDQGKKVLYDLMKTFHVLHSTMDANPQELAYNEGARSVVLRILRTIQTDPAELERMLNEQEGQSRRSE